MKCLVLFSGTGSVEKSLLKKMNNLCEIRGLDLDNTFKPFYNVDILEWDYKKVFEKWVPDYIHGSPVCKEFSNIKHGHQRDLDLGKRLMYKTLEIIEYVKTINPILLYTKVIQTNILDIEYQKVYVMILLNVSIKNISVILLNG